MIKILIKRKKTSYDFKSDPKAKDCFENNWKHNSEDDFYIFEDENVLMHLKCQSVANYCFGSQKPGDTVSYGDSIAEGEFLLKLFVPPRNFHGEIHAITNTKDIDGQWINHEAMQTTSDGYQTGRWLIHDRWSSKTKSDTNFAWSSGCIILSSSDLEMLNAFLHAYKFKSGDMIFGKIEED
ncbi:MAG: hypothetical protein ACTTHG_02990 [Treponemataceae bacterium]